MYWVNRATKAVVAFHYHFIGGVRTVNRAKPTELVSLFCIAAFLSPLLLEYAVAESNPKGDLNKIYIAVHSVSLKGNDDSDFTEFDELLQQFKSSNNPTGLGNPTGYVRFGLHYHFNPISDKFFKLRDNASPPYRYGDFEYRSGVVAHNLDEAATMYPDAHISISIMAGHCYESAFSDFLNQDPDKNFMRNQYDEPVEWSEGEECSSIYPFTPALLQGHKNYYLQALDDNTRQIMMEVKAWADAHPDTVIPGIGLGGPTVFPRGIGNKKADTRWADYRDDFVEGFRQYAMDQYGGDFARFKSEMGLPDGAFDGFADLDPPRFDPLSVNLDCNDRMPGCVQRGDWDLLGDLTHPYFAFWYEYRTQTIIDHYRTISDMAVNVGLGDDYLYAHQGIAWEDNDSYLLKGSSLKTIDPTLTGLLPGLNMYDDKTADLVRMKEVRDLCKLPGVRGGSGSFQYNPGGPCEIIKHDDGTKEKVCDPMGYDVSEYLNRLYMAAGRGDRARKGDRFRLLVIMGDDKENEDAIRDNMREAIKRWLSQGS